MITRALCLGLVLLMLSPLSLAQSPAPGSGAAGVAAWAAANCSPTSTVNPATTANGEFTIELLSVTTAGSLVTFEYEICQVGGQNELSHWVLGLGQIDCLAAGMSIADLVVGGTLNGSPLSAFSIALDPSTQINGFKFDDGASGAACDLWAVTFDTGALAPGFTLGTGGVLAAVKAGGQTIIDPTKPVPGYACVQGPVCAPLPGKIGDFVWRDNDCDGVQDSGEPGLEGLTLTLLKQSDLSVIATTTTDANGAWCFDDLPAGDYVVHLTYNQVSWALSPTMVGGDPTLDSDFDANTGAVAVSLNQGEQRTDVDAGLCVICPGPPATTISYPHGFSSVNDPVITVSDFIPGETVTLKMLSQFPNSPGWIFYSIGPVTPFSLAGGTFYVDVLNQATNLFLVAGFFTDANGDWCYTSADTVPLAWLGYQVIFQGRICASPDFQGPFIFPPHPDFFSNGVVATIGCP